MMSGCVVITSRQEVSGKVGVGLAYGFWVPMTTYPFMLEAR